MTINYHLEFFTVPAAVTVLISLSPPTTNIVISAYIIGYLSWVATEYWMHRWLFHRHYRRDHWVHHLRPTAEEGTTPTWIAHVLLTLLLAGLIALFQRLIGAALGAGFLLGYLSYIVPHHLVHHSHHWLVQNSWWARRHRLHHKGVEANFNLLNPLGDLLFGTYRN